VDRDFQNVAGLANHSLRGVQAITVSRKKQWDILQCLHMLINQMYRYDSESCRSSPIWPIMCRVECKTLLTNSTRRRSTMAWQSSREWL